MYTQLLAALREKTAAFESTGLAFWDDPYISQSMLKAHLDFGADGASRKYGFIQKSVDWIAGLCPAQGKILDLGCGPGLYADLLYNKGFDVTGMDFSKRSIEYAKNEISINGKKIHFQYQDYLTLDEKELYDAVILVYCDFGVLPPSGRALLLDKIFRALKKDGLFVLDVFSEKQYETFSDSNSFSVENGGFWSPEQYLCLKRNISYPNRDYLEQYTVVTETDCQVYNLWNHAFQAAELTEMLENTGFSAIDLFGSIAGEPLDENSTVICAAAKK